MREIAIEQKAMLQLKKLGIEKIPVPIEDVAKMLNVSIGTAPNSDLSGILIRKKNSGLIGVNSDDTYPRQRFTIAHELAHFLLEKKDTFVDTKKEIFYRDSVHIGENEKIANKFAAAILMPKNSLKRDFIKLFQGKLFQDKDLEYLAERYLVSKEAMKYRLAHLNLIEL